MSDEIEALYAMLTGGRKKAVWDRPWRNAGPTGAQRVREHRERQRKAVEA